jgi:pimeloyl-ACP methyl ester carboxylesterase
METTIQGIPIYYEIHGTGKPIVMIHGYKPDHRIMSGCFEPLFNNDSGWQRIYFDLPGMGKTPGPKWLEKSDQMLEIVHDFIKSILPNKPYAVVGESYGGYMVQGLLRKNPQPIKGAMLICPMVTGFDEQRTIPEHASFVRDEALLETLSDEERQGFEEFCVMLTPYVWEKMRDDILSGVNIADFDFLEHFYHTGYAYSFEKDLKNIRYDQPMLILTGKQDTSVGFEDQISLLKQYPHATYLALDRAGHNLQIEQSEVFRALTCEWLRSLKETWH